MDIEKLIHCLQCCARVDAHNVGCDDCGLEYCGPECQQLCWTAATALSTIQAENAQLRAENNMLRRMQPVELNGESARSLSLALETSQLRSELEQVKASRDAAIEYLREIEWCAGCKHFGGLDGCKKWAMGQCTGKHDLYEFIGPQKEG